MTHTSKQRRSWPIFPMASAVAIASAFAVALARADAQTSGPPGSAAPRPNIVLAIADDWSNRHASMFDCKWVSTPSFDRVVREGVLFNHCFTSNPKCSPCRASLLTGRNSWQLEEACCHYGVFPARWPIYPDLLEESGYLVGYTGKGWAPGDWKTGGFKRNPAGPEYSQRKLIPPNRGISNIDYAANFADFLKQRKPGQPFCFWYGGHEPHRPYDDGAGLRAGKKTRDVQLPSYYPDSNLIRSDLLDYAVEVEWFDTHLGRILAQLEEIGELDNTLILVTSDQGMPFPRVKGQIYEDDFHIPLAIRWGKHVKPGRAVDDFINVRDFCPTFLELAGVKVPASVTGRAFVDVLNSEKSGWIDAARNRMLVGKERHDLGRPHDVGYPVRGLRTPEYLYVHNFAPERWPVGNPETGYSNCDNSPTKTFMLSSFDDYYRLCFGFRPAEELYRITDDPECVHNLAAKAQLQPVRQRLREEMEKLLREEQDPRILGRGDVFDTYPYTGDRSHSYDAWLKHQR